MLYYTNMKNMNKNLIFYGFMALAIFTATSPAVSEAYNYNSGYQLRTNLSYAPAPVYQEPVIQVVPVYQPAYQPNYQPQQVVYQNQTQPVYQTYNAPQASTEANTETKPITTGDANITGEDYSAVAANSIWGRFSFMPSGLMQWILLAIFILVIVILVRKITGKDTEYYSTPLKHA